MPTVGSFHGTYWKARANVPLPPGTQQASMYPQWQSVITRSASLGSLFGGLQPLWDQLAWYWALGKRLWRWRDRRGLERWITRLETLDPERRVVLERVCDALEGPFWSEARQAVRTCATTPKFHQPEQWIEYGQTLKQNKGQTQNVFRHIKAVSLIRPLKDGEPARLSNPDAHLVIELAYQGMAAMGRPDRQVIQH